MADKYTWIGQLGPIVHDPLAVSTYPGGFYGDGVDLRGIRTSQGYIEELPTEPHEIARLQEIDDLIKSEHLAGEILGTYRLVRIATDNKAWYADNTVPAYADAIYGLTLHGAALGADVTVQYLGIISDITWTWVTAGALFLGTTGLLTQTAPTTGFLLVVGFAITATKIMFAPKNPIILV